MQIIHSIDKLGIWHRLPVFMGLIYLAIRRNLHQTYNLFNVGNTPTGDRFNSNRYNETAGSEGTFFGRNILPRDNKDKVYLNFGSSYIYGVNCSYFN